MKKLFFLGVALSAATMLSAACGSSNQRGQYYPPQGQGQYYPAEAQGGRYYQGGAEGQRMQQYQGTDRSQYQGTDRNQYRFGGSQYQGSEYRGNGQGLGQTFGYYNDQNNPDYMKDKFTTEEDRRLARSIRASWGQRYPNVTLKIDNGNVVLKGSVRTRDEKDLIERDLRGIQGINNVDNKIDVNENGTGSNYQGGSSYQGGSY